MKFLVPWDRSGKQHQIRSDGRSHLEGRYGGLLRCVSFEITFLNLFLVRDRVRRPTKTGLSWIDRRFVREQTDRLSRDAMLLYFFLCAVADQNGLSYYGDATLTARLRMSAAALEQAQDELLSRDLFTDQPPLTETPLNEELFQLRDVLREAAGLPASDNPCQELQ